MCLFLFEFRVKYLFDLPYLIPLESQKILIKSDNTNLFTAQ